MWILNSTCLLYLWTSFKSMSLPILTTRYETPLVQEEQIRAERKVRTFHFWCSEAEVLLWEGQFFFLLHESSFFWFLFFFRSNKSSLSWKGRFREESNIESNRILLLCSCTIYFKIFLESWVIFKQFLPQPIVWIISYVEIQCTHTYA